jgi:hypothetical protein
MFHGLKIGLIILLVQIGQLSYSQFTPTLGYKASAISGKTLYQRSHGATRNTNQTYDYYIIHNRLNPIAHTLSLRSFGGKYIEDKKFNVGYSIDIGLQQFRSSSILVYDYSSTTDRDSIVNAYDGFRFNTNYTVVYFNHFIDFNLKLSDNIRFTQSIGVGLSAPIRARSKNVEGTSETMIDTDFPLTFNVVYEPQIIEKYEKFDVSYFFSVSLISGSVFGNKEDDAFYDQSRIKLSELNFNGIGIRFIPHMKLKEEFSPLEYE